MYLGPNGEERLLGPLLIDAMIIHPEYNPIIPDAIMFNDLGIAKVTRDITITLQRNVNNLARPPLERPSIAC